MEMLQGVWKQHLRLRVVVGYGVKIFLPSPPNYVIRSPGVIRPRKAKDKPVNEHTTPRNNKCNIETMVYLLQSVDAKIHGS